MNNFSHPISPKVTRLTVRLSDGRILRFSGRIAWALNALIEAGPRGVVPIDRPAPRWSQYIMSLRRKGIAIETITESHGGPFKGSHGRYVLTTELVRLEMTAA